MPEGPKPIRGAMLVLALLLLAGLLWTIWTDNRIPDRQTLPTAPEQQP